MDKLLINIPCSDPIELISYYDNFVNYYPNCEPETKKWCVHNIKKDWIILDCGANIGYFTILFARLSAHVHAFEPTSTFHMLWENIAYNNIENVTIVNKALGNKIGIYNDLFFRIWGTESELLSCNFTTIDEYTQHFSRLDLIKIDVDSFDYEVFQGAQSAIAKFNPYIIVEINGEALSKRGYTSKQFFDYILSRGYKKHIFLDKENMLLFPINL